MFEFAFVGAHGRTARPYTFMVSVAGQLGLVGLSILIPLIFVLLAIGLRVLKLELTVTLDAGIKPRPTTFVLCPSMCSP